MSLLGRNSAPCSANVSHKEMEDVWTLVVLVSILLSYLVGAIAPNKDFGWTKRKIEQQGSLFRSL